MNVKEFKEYGGDLSQLDDIDEYIAESVMENYGELFSESERENFKVIVHKCNSEKELLRKLFDTIHKQDPTVIAGFNSVNFDFPYIYNRLKKLNEDPSDYMSKFGEVEYYGYEIDAPDYKYVDLRYLYVPDGMGFGDSLESYSLDTVAKHVLGFKKVEYEADNLDELYIKDIKRFLFYNMIDTILLKKLDQKLKHIELFNSLRRMSRSLFHIGYKGRSYLGEDLIRYLLYKDEKEVARDFLPELKIPFAKDKEKFKTYFMSLKNFGAYVMNPPNDVFRGLIVDYDQTSMYPSIDVMFNIDYTTLQARVYPLFTSNFIRLILSNLYRRYVKSLTDFNNALTKFTNIWKNICDLFSEIYSPPGNNKSEFREYNTEFTIKLILAIFKKASDKRYDDIIEYIKQADYFESISYIYPLFENFTHILSVFESEINPVAYFYLVSNSQDEFVKLLRRYYETFVKNRIDSARNKLLDAVLSESINSFKTFVVLKPTDSKIHFELFNVSDLPKTLFSEYIVTPTGSLFSKHDDKLSVQTRFITTFMRLRKEVQKRAQELFEQNKIELSEEMDRTQLAIKILLNSISYGISILPLSLIHI